MSEDKDGLLPLVDTSARHHSNWLVLNLFGHLDQFLSMLLG